MCAIISELFILSGRLFIAHKKNPQGFAALSNNDSTLLTRPLATGHPNMRRSHTIISPAASLRFSLLRKCARILTLLLFTLDAAIEQIATIFI